MKRLETDYATELNKATTFANQFIDIGSTTQNDVLLIKRLIELIRDDNDIPDDSRFVISRDGESITKIDLVKANEINLPAFLLDVWKFIVTNPRDNSIGAATMATWFPDGPGRYKGINGSTIEQEIKIDFDLSFDISDSTVGSCADTDKISDSIRDYLEKTYNLNKKVKSLLSEKMPREFYSLYVCNDLKYDKDKIISDISVDLLRSISNFTILSGIGGLGKTMMMHHFLLNAIENYDTIKLLPIYISLKDFNETTKSLDDYILSAITKFNVNMTTTNLTSLLNDGACLLLFDGMDEIKSSAIEQFFQEFESLAYGYSNNCFVLSSRPSHLLFGLFNFCEFELQPFSMQQALKMVENFALNEGDERFINSFRVRLESDLWWRHKEFVENPLLLMIMLMNFKEHAEVPSELFLMSNVH